MRDLLLRLLNIVALFGSVVGLLSSWNPARDSYSAGELGFIVATLVLFICLAILEIRSYRKGLPLRLKNDGQIRDYMYKWISEGDRVHIFSRDLSWVEDDAMRQMLCQKAERNELNITVPRHVALLDEFITAGADVNYYEDIDYTPQSRFTIANWGRSDARIAVGRSERGVHVVEEFSAGGHPVFYVANDLVEMARKCGAH